jgi:hypothetical protein
MRRIVLASVPSDMSLPEALERIHSGTRAVVVDDSDGGRLVTAGDIMAASNAALDAGRKPEDVKVGSVVSSHARTTAPLLPHSFNIPAGVGGIPDLTQQEHNHFGTAFNASVDKRYVVQHLSADAALVVTASELFAVDLADNVTICTCAGDPKHSFEPRQLRVPGKCNKPHGVPVTCRSVGVS